MNALSTSANDSNKVNVLLKLSDHYRSTNTSVCLDYCEKALTLAQKVNFERGLLKGYLRKATALSKTGDNETALKELQKGEKYFNGGKFKIHQAEFTLRKGYIEWKTKKLDEAIATFTRGDSIYRSYNNSVGSVECFHVIARIYAGKGNYTKAVEYCDKAIDLAEKNKEWLSACDAYIVLGNIFMQQQNYDKALTCYQKTLEYSLPTGDNRLISGSYLSIGNCYLYKHDRSKNNKDLATAKENYLACLKIREQENDEIGVAYTLSNLGEVELKEGNAAKACDYFNRGVILAEKLKDPELMLGSYLSLSGAELTLNKLNEAEKHALSAIMLSKKFVLGDYEWKAKSALSKIYFAKGKFKEAYLYKDSTAILKDTLINQQQAKLSLELEEKFQNEKKENEIKVQKLDLELKDSEIAKGKQQKMIIVGVLMMVVVFSVILFNRFKVINKQNAIITKQKNEVEEKNVIIEEKQKEIFDSLQYAQQIQKLLLANHKLVNETLPDSFIVFKPKDIVSGDFYWAAKKENRFYLAVCDSTGHGVPGAFMSLLNINFLNEAIIEKNIEEPNDVFNYVRKRLIENISQNGRQDGMDGILICVKEGSKKITYAAANNVPFVIKNNALSVLNADKMPIGKGEKNEPFKLYEFEMSKGDQLYLYTDGFADQFGGPKGKKYKYKPFYDFILSNNNLPVLEQEELLYAEFENWRGALEQVDDVCILGARF